MDDAAHANLEHARSVRDLFDEVVDLAPSTRNARLDAVARTEADLVRDVRELLIADEQTTQVLERLDGSAHTDPYRPGTLQIGQTVSHYRVLGQLGSGGMGVVYRAEDTRLHRPVALKFLPPGWTQDPEARERLLLEARAAGALDHPYLCTVYDVGETEAGEVFIAMACYEGETLRQRIERGPLPVGEALEVATQIAEGLAAAHGAGLVHRDVKSANVMVTVNGTAKLLDFGLATLDGKAPDEVKRWGTVAYMSPEQARGEEVDHRTDIWSFGMLLYEMLTGEGPFVGSHGQAVLDRLRHGPPEPLPSHPGVPPLLAHVVENALAREPGERYDDMDAVLADLRAVQRQRRGGSVVAGRLRWALAGGVAALVVLSAISMRSGGGEPRTHPPSHQRVTSTGTALMPELSPDGESVAYIEGTSETEQRVVVQSVSGGSRIVILERCYECWNLRWTPDGSALAFSAVLDPARPPGTYSVPRTGGALRQLDRYLTFFDWSPDGSRYAGTRGKAIVVVGTGGMERLDLDEDVHRIRNVEWSPGGNHLLFVSHDEHRRHVLWTVPLIGGHVQKIAEAAADIFTPRWSADGEAIYYLERQGGSQNLLRVRVDPQSGERASSPMAVLTGMSTDDTFSLSGDGDRLAYSRMTVSSNLWLLTLARSGAESDPSARLLTPGTGWSGCPSISPDGQTIAYYQATLNDGANVFVMPLEGGSPMQLTHTASTNRCPVWSPDGTTLAFLSNEGGHFGLWTIGADGRTPQSSPNARPGNPAQFAWAPGERLVFRPSGEIGLHMTDPRSLDQKPTRVDAARTLQRLFSPRYAPGGRRVAVWGWDSDTSRGGLWVLRLDDNSKTLLLEGEGVPHTPVGWSRDGKWIYLLEREIGAGRLTRVHSDSGERRLLAVLPDDISRGLSGAVPQVAVTPDGRQFVFPVTGARISDIEIVEHFDPGGW